MTNPLLNDALELGATRQWQPQGCLKVYKKSTTGAWAGKVVTLELTFYDPKELTMAVKWAMDNGYSPEPPAGATGNGQETIKPMDLASPTCPIHGKAMINKGRGYFCPSKMPDGTWCKQKAK